MATKKEFSINTRCSEAELANKTNSGWQIQYMQFMQDGTLHVVFFRDVACEAAPSTTEVVVTPVEPPRPIPNKPLAGMVIIGLDQPRSVPRTFNKPEKGATRPVNVPTGDPVIEQAFERGRAVFDEAMAKGAEAIRDARPDFAKH